MAYITCKDLALGYEGKVVTEQLNFSVEKGDYLLILGENGAGKSTLMKALLQLIAPISGEIVYGDGLKPFEIGYLPQQTVVQRDFPASVWEIVLSGNLTRNENRFFYGKKEKARAQENMERLGIWEMRKKSYRTLSGGQQQRVLLARALCAAGRVILLDEPVSGLDPKVTADMYQLIARLNREGVTVLMVSHDLTSALEHASHVLHVGRKQMFFGTTEDYKKSKAYRYFEAAEAPGEIPDAARASVQTEVQAMPEHRQQEEGAGRTEGGGENE